MTRKWTGTLHLLCEEAKWSEAIQYIEQNPTQAREEACEKQGWNQWTPLTISCVRAEISFLEILVKLAPEACSMADRSGSLPLHFASCWRRGKETPDVLQLLIDAAPSTLYTANQWGQTPLHSAFDSREFPSSKIVKVLLRQLPRDILETDDPTFFTTGNFNTEDSEAYFSVKRKDRRGRLPLHIAATKGFPYTIIRLLVQAYPASACISDREGLCSVHLYTRYLLQGKKLEANGYSAGSKNISTPPAVSGGRKNPQSPPSRSNAGDDLTSTSSMSASTVHLTQTSSSSMVDSTASNKLHQWNHQPISAVTTAIMELLLRPCVDSVDVCRIELNEDDSDDEADGGDVMILETVSENPSRTYLSHLPEDHANHLVSMSQQPGGYTALHIACLYNCSSSTIGRLLKTYPAAARVPVKNLDFRENAMHSYRLVPPSHPLLSSIPLYAQRQYQYLYPIDLLQPHATIYHAFEQKKGCHHVLGSNVGMDGKVISNSESYAGLVEWSTKCDLVLVYFPEIEFLRFNGSPGASFQVQPGSSEYVQDREGSDEQSISTKHQSKQLHYSICPARLNRFVYYLRAELLHKKLHYTATGAKLVERTSQSKSTGMSAFGKLVWWYLCRFPQVKSSMYSSNYSSSIFNLNSKDQTIDVFVSGTCPFTRELNRMNTPLISNTDNMNDFDFNKRSREISPRNSSLVSGAVLRAIGHSLLNLDAAHLWALTFMEVPDLMHGLKVSTIKDSSDQQVGTFVKIALHDDCTVFLEAEARAANLTFQQLVMDVCGSQFVDIKSESEKHGKDTNPSISSRNEADWRGKSFKPSHHASSLMAKICSYLSPNEAQILSSSCTLFRKCGVRLSNLVPVTLAHSTHYHGTSERPDIASSGIGGQPLTKIPILSAACHAVYVTFQIANNSSGIVLCIVETDPKHSHHPPIVIARSNTQLHNQHVSSGMARNAIIFQPRSHCEYYIQVIQKNKKHLHPSYTATSGTPTGKNLIWNINTRQLWYSGHHPLHYGLKGDLSELSTLQTMAKYYATQTDAKGRLPLHLAVEHGVGMEVLVTIIRAYPAALIYSSPGKSGGTPLHAAFRNPMLHSSFTDDVGDEAKNDKTSYLVNTIKSLLWITPGEMATRIREEEYGNLPLHIACERGVHLGEVLQLLVDCHPDSPIRVNSNGDLPAHLLAASSHDFDPDDDQNHPTSRIKLFRDGMEKLLQPCAAHPSICKINGFQGQELPLHLACEFNVSFNVIKGILSKHPEGASIPRIRIGDSKNKYPVEILEDHRKFLVSEEEVQALNQKSDLLLAFYPYINNNNDGVLYRRDPERLKRLENLIRDEARFEGELSETARKIWVLFCTHSGPPIRNRRITSSQEQEADFLEDNYTENVRNIVQGLDPFHLQYLASIRVNQTSLWDMATSSCRELLQKCFLFVGRYEIEDSFSVHTSATCVVVCAKDFVGMEEFKVIQRNLALEGQSVPASQFLKLCKVLSIPSATAQNYLSPSHTNLDEEDDLRSESSSSEVMNSRSTEQKNDWVLEKNEFEAFCTEYQLDENGARAVCIKFLLHGKHYERDVRIRNCLFERSPAGIETVDHGDYMIVPILDDYCVPRDDEKDQRYAVDIKKRFVNDLFRFHYALVMPRGERNLDAIYRHERLTMSLIREQAMNIGLAIQHVHQREVIHCDVTMTNVIRLGAHLCLTDFDSACRRKVRGKSAPDFPGAKFSSGVLPPEMICKLDLDQTRQYNRYWKSVSDDAKDLKLLTPDDIQAITDEVKILVEDTPVLSKPSPSEVDYDWKENISSALAMMSFEDLPSSLANCHSITEFASVWDRIISNAELWEKLKPRVGADGSIYVVKAYKGDIEDEYSLPYDLFIPTEKLDIWSFGVLLFALCSGGPLFKVNRFDDLDEVSSYSQLEAWDRKSAEIAIKKVTDPLAQDLLMKLLVREDDRLSSMKAVLRHPFFGSTSNLEALKILEKHEEQQLLLEETTTIPLVTTETLNKLDHSTEKHCKIVFETLDVVAPTCVMALPYQLKWDFEEERLVAPNPEIAKKIGQHLLDINAATARLSFWLAMKKNFVDNNGGFQERLTVWLQRGSSEPDEVCNEILTVIGYTNEYSEICKEMLQVRGEFNTHLFIRDPMGVAKEAIRSITNSLDNIYGQESVFLYLIDEFTGTPILARPKDDVYPILIQANLLHIFLPFMNIGAMAMTAMRGIEGLADLLGLPRKDIPTQWGQGPTTLIHRSDQPPTVTEFAVLQDVLEKLQSPDEESIDEISISESKLRQLESFFRERDHLRTFSSLRRLCDGKGPAIWTTEDVIKMIQDQALQASLEARLRNLTQEWLKREQLQVEISFLSGQLKLLNPNSKLAAEALEITKTKVINASANEINRAGDLQVSSKVEAANVETSRQKGSVGGGARKRQSWAAPFVGRQPSTASSGRRFMKRRSWAAFDNQKEASSKRHVVGDVDAGQENYNDKASKPKESNRQRPRKRQSWSFIRRKPSSVDNVEKQHPKVNRSHRQSWAAFSTEDKVKDSWSDDDIPTMSRVRSPSVDSIFRRSATNMTPEKEPIASNMDDSVVMKERNTTEAQKRSSWANFAAKLAGGGRRPSVNNESKGRRGSATKRSSWAQFAESLTGRNKPRPEPLLPDSHLYDDDDEDHGAIRVTESKVAESKQTSTHTENNKRRDSAARRSSWAQFAAGLANRGKNSKNRPEPLIDEADLEDESDDDRDGVGIHDSNQEQRRPAGRKSWADFAAAQASGNITPVSNVGSFADEIKPKKRSSWASKFRDSFTGAAKSKTSPGGDHLYPESSNYHSEATNTRNSIQSRDSLTRRRNISLTSMGDQQRPAPLIMDSDDDDSIGAQNIHETSGSTIMNNSKPDERLKFPRDRRVSYETMKSARIDQLKNQYNKASSMTSEMSHNVPMRDDNVAVVISSKAKKNRFWGWKQRTSKDNNEPNHHDNYHHAPATSSTTKSKLFSFRFSKKSKKNKEPMGVLHHNHYQVPATHPQHHHQAASVLSPSSSSSLPSAALIPQGSGGSRSLAAHNNQSWGQTAAMQYHNNNNSSSAFSAGATSNSASNSYSYNGTSSASRTGTGIGDGGGSSARAYGIVA